MKTSLWLKTLMLMFAGAMTLAVAGCDEGPAEKAGKNIDEAVTDAGNAIEDKCEALKEKADAKDTDC